MSAYSDLVLLDRPVAYFPLTESGTAIGDVYVDATGHGYDVAVRQGVLTHTAGPLTGTTAPSFPDLGDTAPYFDALVGHRTLGLPVDGHAYSLEGWIKPQAEPDIGWMQWIGYGPGADAGHESTKFIGSDLLVVGSSLLSSPPNQLETSNVANGVSTPVATLLTDGAWHHIVITDDAIRTTTFYVDGVLIAALDNGGFGNGVVYYTDNLLVLGCPGNDNGAFPVNSLVTNEPYVGGLAHAAIYRYALTPCHVLSHYDEATTGSHTPCVPWVRLSHSSGQGYWQSRGDVTEEWAGGVKQLALPLATLTTTPATLVGQDPATNLPAYCPAPVPSTTTVVLGGGGGRPAPPTTCVQMRCGVSFDCAEHLASLDEQWSRWLDHLVAGVTEFSLLLLVIDPFFDELILGMELASDIAIAKAIKEVLKLGVGAITGSLFPVLDADERNSLQHPLFCQLRCSGDVVTIAATDISVWHDAVANLTGLPGLSRDLLTLLLQFTPLADWQAVASQSSASSACNAWTCP